MEQLRLVARWDGVVQFVGGGQWRPVQTLRASKVEISFVDRRHFDRRSERLQDFEDAAGVFKVAIAMALDKDCLRAQFMGGAQGHGGMHSEFAGGVGGGGNHATLVGPASHHHGLTFE